MQTKKALRERIKELERVIEWKDHELEMFQKAHRRLTFLEGQPERTFEVTDSRGRVHHVKGREIWKPEREGLMVKIRNDDMYHFFLDPISIIDVTKFPPIVDEDQEGE